MAEDKAKKKIAKPMFTVYRVIHITPDEWWCPKCGKKHHCHSKGSRTLKEVGVVGPTKLIVYYTKFFCSVCQKHYSADMGHIAAPGARYTNRVKRLVLSQIDSQGHVRAKAKHHGMLCLPRHQITVPPTTAFDWWQEESGKENANA